MTRPVRLQLSRKKGFRLQAHSRSVNGLPAIVVARPGRWGNPFRPAPAIDSEFLRAPAMTLADCVAAHREMVEMRLASPTYRAAMLADLATLRGKNLACWCPPGAPCHADTLIELANPPGEGEAGAEPVASGGRR